MEDAWVKLLGSTDLVAILAIAVLAYFLESTKKVPDSIAVLVPLVLGGLWGALQGAEQGWGFNAAIVKGVLVNGAAASVTARVVAHWLPGFLDKGATPPASEQKPPTP